MKKIVWATVALLLLLTFVSCSFYEPGTIIVQGGTVYYPDGRVEGADTSATAADETKEPAKETTKATKQTTKSTTADTTADTTIDTTVDTTADTTVDATADTTVDTTKDTTTDTATDTAADTVTDTTSDTAADTATAETEQDQSTMTFVLNTNTKKFHLPTCRYAKSIKAQNRKEVVGIDQLIDDSGYEPCKVCLKDFKFKID